MNYLKVTALLSILALVPACSWTKKDCGTACCPTTTVTTDAAATTAVEVKEEGSDGLQYRHGDVYRYGHCPTVQAHSRSIPGQELQKRSSCG